MVSTSFASIVLVWRDQRFAFYHICRLRAFARGVFLPRVLPGVLRFHPYGVVGFRIWNLFWILFHMGYRMCTNYRFKPFTAQRNFADFALGLAKHSSAEGRIGSGEMELKTPPRKNAWNAFLTLRSSPE